jgi:transposase
METELPDLAENDLSERDLLLAALVASGRSVREAGHEIGLSDSTCYRIANRPAFRSKVSEHRTEAMQAALGSLAAFARNAAERLQELTRSADESVALRAATAILDRFGKLSESVDLRVRVEQLEKQVRQ